MKEIDKIIIATHNPAKVERYKKLFYRLAREVVGLDGDEKPDETGKTAEENSQIKAIFYASKKGAIVFSEDEALYVDFLPESEQPGVFVRRINGKNDATDPELLKYWAQIISKVPEDSRTGKWHIAYTLANPTGKFKTVSMDHQIRFYYPPSLIKWPGWPLSSIQGKVIFTKPQTEYSPVEKMEDERRANEAIRENFKSLLKEFNKR